MLQNSVISQSGQTWKLIVAVLALLIGSFAPLYAGSGISWTTGSVIAIAGYAFGLLTIRCSECGSRWFWEAALGNCGYGQLFRQPSCPKCDKNFATG